MPPHRSPVNPALLRFKVEFEFRFLFFISDFRGLSHGNSKVRFSFKGFLIYLAQEFEKHSLIWQLAAFSFFIRFEIRMERYLT